MVVEKVPRWESELWFLISCGDGENCPIYSQCGFRLEGGWCIDDDKNRISRLVYSVDKDERLHSARFNFIKPVQYCEILSMIESLAQDWLQKGRVFCPPVPSELALQADEHRRIEVRLVPLKTHNGAIWLLREGWVIHLKHDDPRTRQRFTLFHEAFHILAHCKSRKPVFRRVGAQCGTFNEVLAEAFATFVLMPEKWVRIKWAEVKDLDELARIFQVSVPALHGRLRMIGLI